MFQRKLVIAICSLTALLTFYTGATFCWAETQKGPLWHLVFVAQPAGSSKSPALLQVADPYRSDIGLIGMMIDCGDPAQQAMLRSMLVVADPLPLHTEPQVRLSISGSGPDLTFKGAVTSAGAAVTFNLDLRGPAPQAWGDDQALKVTLTAAGQAVSGFIPLNGLKDGLKNLTSACANP